METEGSLQSLLERLSPEVVDSFTPEQRAALWMAGKPTTWLRHPINMRMSIPTLGGRRYFLTIVGGAEKRSTDRIRRERRVFPLRTLGNILFLLGLGTAFTLTAMAGLVVFSNLIEF